MYGTHRKCGGRWERRQGRFSPILTCSKCHVKKRIGIKRRKLFGETFVQQRLGPAMLF